MTFLDRLQKQEHRFTPAGTLPGTQLVRVLSEKEGEGTVWSLGLGALMQPKQFFLGSTPLEALKQAEKAKP